MSDYPAGPSPSLSVLASLRALGARRVVFAYDVTNSAGWPSIREVEFFESAPPATKEAAPTQGVRQLDLGAPQMCPCGHDELSHNGEGYCLAGCDADKCSPERPPP